MKKISYLIQLEKENPIVTDYYLRMIGQSLEAIGNKVEYSRGWDKDKVYSSQVVIVSTATSAMKTLLHGKDYIFWAQGLWPEESFMRNNSLTRKKVCSYIEKVALKYAKYIFVVSKPMLIFYEKKYELALKHKSFIMPCSNESFHIKAFEDENKYKKNIFCFAGSTSVWQCFEETIKLYSYIENKYLNTQLLLLVKDKEKAIGLIQKYSIKNYEIDYVKVEELEERLKQVKFGFLLREDSSVNRVATPTKLLTYLANGIIPIYSECLDGVNDILKETQYKISYKNDFDISIFSQWLEEKIDVKLLLQEYRAIYRNYYDEREKKREIVEFFKKNEY